MNELETVAEPTPVVAPKRGRGRPRIHPAPDPNAPKRGRGRPKKTKEEEKAELDAIRIECLEKRATRTQKIRDFNPENESSNDAQAVFSLSCHLIQRNLETGGEKHITGGELMDLVQNLTNINLRGAKSDNLLCQGVHRISKYDTVEVKDGIDTFAYGQAPDGKPMFAKEMNKKFEDMHLFWPDEMDSFYIANSPTDSDGLEQAARYIVRKS